jgi:hypothetical protein
MGQVAAVNEACAIYAARNMERHAKFTEAYLVIHGYELTNENTRHSWGHWLYFSSMQESLCH